MNEVDPFDGPSPVGPLGQAMARLADDIPEADFDAWTIRSRHGLRRSTRRQLSGGLAAGVAVIAAFVLIGVGVIGSGGSDSASTVTASTAAASAAATSSSSSSASTSAGALGAGTQSATAAAPAPASGSAADGGSATGSSSASCRPLPFSAGQLAAVESTIGGLSRQDSCAVDAADTGAQRFTVAGGTVVAEVRTDGYDPCPGLGGTACADVAGRPGVRTVELRAVTGPQTQVWLASPTGSVVLTADPAGIVSVAELAAAAEALAAAG